MKGALFAAGILTVMYVGLQPNSASKVSSGTGVIAKGLRKLLSASSPGIPNLHNTTLTGGDNGNGTSTEAPGAPGKVKVPGTSTSLNAPVISV